MIDVKKINSLILPFFYRLKYQYLNSATLNFIINKNVNKDKIHLNFSDDREYLQEYQIKELSKNMYSDIHFSVLKKKDFFYKDYLNPEISYILNEASKNINIPIDENKIEFKNVEIIDNYNSYGIVRSNNKLLGFFDKSELFHEISVGMIGPEISSIWDNRPIKQNVIVSIESDINNIIIKLERGLIFKNTKWILSGINYL